MSLDTLVQVSISSTSVAVQQAGFGLPMILSASASFPQRYRTYTDLDGITDDGFATTSPEYLAASAMLAQNPSPPTIAIGRRALKPSQKFEIAVYDSVSADTDYTITVEGEGVTTTTVSVDSSSDNAATLLGNLATELNGVTGANYTASVSGSDTLVVEGDAAGNFFSLNVNNIGLLSNQQTHLDAGVATDLAAIADENDSWYFLVNPFNSEAEMAATAAWAESNKKLYVAATCDSRSGTVAVGGGDPLDDLKTNAYARTAGVYHPSVADFADAAWIGKMAPKNPGSATWNYKTLAGVASVDLTSTHITNIESKYGNYYRTVAGVNITSGGGKVGANEYIDVVRGKDWMEARIAEGIFSRLAGSDKIPYTDVGTAVVQAEVAAVLKLAVERGVLAASPAPEVTVPFVADVLTADKQNRVLRDVIFTGTLAGAIHTLIIQGVISV